MTNQQSAESPEMLPIADVAADAAIALAARGALADSYGPLIRVDRPIDAALLGAEPTVVIGADVLVGEGPAASQEIDAIISTVSHAPIASVALCVLLRTTTSSVDTPARFVLESATYSTLQAGPEFARWRAARPFKDRVHTDEPAVLADRHGDTLRVRLNRPRHGNAVNTDLRDALTEALTTALVDGTIDRVELTGNGPHFCTGGDLDEFGMFTSPAAAHVVRLARSPARYLAALGPRLHAHLHGNCMGSGIELAAFAHEVTADPATTFVLPELALGLVPGAGGTISIVDRIGAPRTAWLLLTQQRIDAATALAWGLIDRIV